MSLKCLETQSIPPVHRYRVHRHY